jgi:hypothetical protein
MRMSRLFDTVNYYDIGYWSNDFMQEMESIKSLQYHF